MTLQYVEISSKYTRPRDQFDRERLAQHKATRNHKKRHSVNKEKAHEDRKKHAQIVKQRNEWLESRKDFIGKVRAYWMAMGDHP